MEDIADVFLNDVLVPQVFISDYLSDLSQNAIKVYLMAQMYKNGDSVVDSTACRKPLGLAIEDFKAAILELDGHGIIRAENNLSSFTLLDLKRSALDKYYRRITSKSMTESVNNNESSAQRTALINSVNDTYFQGMMGPTWYQAIDNWFSEYLLEPPVVYQMFVDASERNVLNGPQYLNAVAKDYYKNNVRTFNDLMKYKENNKKISLLSKDIGKIINKNMSTYDKDMVDKWYNVYGYDFDVIEVALRAVVRLSEPNMNYFDKILSSWHEAGIKSKAEAEHISANNQNYGNRKIRAAKGKASRNYIPIQEREYEEGYLEQFYDFAFLEDENEESVSGEQNSSN